MTTRRTRALAQSVTVTGSHVGCASPISAVSPVRPLGHIRVSDAADEDMRERIARGLLASPLPYAVLSDYGREDEQLQLPAIELANDEVRVTILPTLGGRVWSITSQTDGRELVHRNSRLRWANFGLTDAWFAGGIEWNLGSTGHSTTSNLPMYAAVLDTSLGPVVRLWEWERTRDLILQVDLWLRGPRLMASTRVTNPDPEPKPLYYWTNIAVAETAHTRVLTPASTAWRTDYSGVLDRVSVPFPDGNVDVSRPRDSAHAADYFYEVGDQVGALIAAVEPDGRGVAQTSTRELRGRKLFLWGDAPGGRRWQDWLGEPGNRYLEIQAGVCATQMEHDLLDGHASRTWTEAFVPVELDAAMVAADYDTAAEAARAAVHELAAPQWLDARHDEWLRTVAEVAPEPDQVLHRGAGWGRAELALRGAAGPTGTPFLDVDDESEPFVAMARGAAGAEVLAAMSTERPTLPVISARWTARLAALGQEADASASWWVPYSLGTAHHVAGDHEGARTAYTRSVEILPTAVALRGLALLTDDATERADLYARALALTPGDRRLATEWLVALRATGHAGEVVSAVASLPEPVRHHGRVRHLLAEALADVGDRDAALEILRELVVPDLAEGGRELSDLWHRLQPGQPVPAHLDFRMVPEGE